MNLQNEIENYIPVNEQEENDNSIQKTKIVEIINLDSFTILSSQILLLYYI